jgi:hypothetical protein
MSHHLAGNGGVTNNFNNNHFGLEHSHLLQTVHAHIHSEPTSEQDADADADADADEDMSYLPADSQQPTNNPSITVIRSEKINLQAVDPVLYGLRRSVRVFLLTPPFLAPRN